MTDAPTLDRSRESFRGLVTDADGPAVVKLSASLDVDVTPLASYDALADESEYTFLLESADKVASFDPDGAFDPADPHAGSRARYSFVGYDPEAVVTVTPEGTTVESLGGRATDFVEPGEGDALDSLRGALPDVERLGFSAADRERFVGGLVGFLAYDAVYDLWLEEVGVGRPDPVVPDAQFVLTTKTLVFDDAPSADDSDGDDSAASTDSAGTGDTSLSLLFTPVVRPEDDPDAVYDELLAEAERVRETLAGVESGSRRGPETASNGFVRTGETTGPRDEYEAAVRRAKEHVLDGDIYQGVISRTRELRGDVDPQDLYAALRDVNPSPYMYLLQHGDRSVVGASPETLVTVRDGQVVSNPLAGTCARGTSPVEDRRLAGELLADDKERAEHTMLVDLARNDVRRVAEPGSVRVEEFMNVLKYSHVQHIESTVTGSLAADADAFDAVRVSFPAGTLTGAPKVRAMELIDELELSARGLYGGGVGYFSWTDDADFAIVIRTATIEHGRGGSEDDRLRVQAGAGIVADSDPTAEYEETEKKMGGVLAAVERIERSTDGPSGTAHGTFEEPGVPR